MKIIYFDLKHALEQHKKVLSVSGGKSGNLDLNHFQSILEFVKNDDYYLSFEDKVTYLLFSIAKSHDFIDGNKRTAIALGAYIMEVNGYGNRVGNFIIQMENIIVWVAENKVDNNLLKKIVENLMQKGEIEEETQIELVEAVGEE